MVELKVNRTLYQVQVEPETPLLYVLRNELGLRGAKYACGQEQCGACNVLIDGDAVPSCHVAAGAVQGSEIITIEGLGAPANLHPLQQAFVEEQATQCGYCTPGLVIAAQGLLNKHRYPTQEQINQALDGHVCRCGTHERVRRAIKLRVARPDQNPLYETRNLESWPAETPKLPYSLAVNPALDDWIKLDQDETITVFSGKVEYGQGLRTALAQIAAEELDVAVERVEVVMGDTERTPDEGMTVGSMSLQTSGQAIRQAAAEARQALLQLAVEELEAWPDNLVVNDGLISDQASGKSVSYWELLGGQSFNRQIKGAAQLKTADAYKLVGHNVQRVDLLAKVTGTHVYVQDLTWDDMLHARVVRPPHYHARLASVDTACVEHIPGVQVIRDGSFLGVIAEREVDAVRAMQELAAHAAWEGDPLASNQESLYAEIEAQIDESYLVVGGTATLDPIPALHTPAGAAQTIQATYTKPYHMHATLGPSAAAAWTQGDKLTIWGHSQGAFTPRDNIAQVLKMPPEQLHFIHTEGSGCYGHNGADDAALDAALLARAAPGRPILLKWTCQDEHQWEPYSPAAVIKMQASLDEQGDVIDWQHQVYSPPHLGRGQPGAQTSGLLAAWHLAEPLPSPPLSAATWYHVGSHRNADPLYEFRPRRIVKHVQLKPALRVSALRGLGAFANVFALESFVDEVAHAAGLDPVEFRLRNLADERAIAVIEAAAEKAQWGTALPEDWGRGIAFARYRNSAAYCAVVVQVCVQDGKIELKNAIIVGEAGQAVNPDGLSNQLEGGFIQAASMTLKEQVLYGPGGIRSTDWETYPVATFSEIPAIQTLILNRPGAPFLGSGEASVGPTPAAIANAVYDAVGVRLRDIPLDKTALLTN